MQASSSVLNANNLNVHSTIAQQLANPRILSTEEQLFRDAVKVVEAKRKHDGNLPKFSDDLNSAKSLEDVQQLLQKEKASNAVWKEPVGKSWMENFAKFAEKVWYYKVIIDAVGTRSEQKCPATFSVGY